LSIRFSYNCSNLSKIPGTVVEMVEIHSDLAQMAVREDTSSQEKLYLA
jgi:hypothetical protein